MKFTLELHRLPFKPLKTQIIYTEGKEDLGVNKFILEHYELIQAFCIKRGVEFCYLPLLAEEVCSAESISYNAPYATVKELPQTIGNDFILNFMLHPENREKVPPSLIYAIPSCYSCSDEPNADLSLYSGYSFEPSVNKTFKETFFIALAHAIDEIKNIKKSGVLFRTRKDTSRDSVAEQDATFIDRRSFSKEIRFSIANEKPDADSKFDREAAKIADEVFERIKRLEKKGITRYLLEQYISGKEQLSRLRITSDYRIFLPDYENMEIEMKPLPKAVFLLFLRHPEGIMFSYLPDFRDELREIYKRVKSSPVSAATERSIENVTDPLSNSINEKCSRIREAFVSRFEEHLAQNYFITGTRGEPKRIKLPRQLVEWETPLT